MHTTDARVLELVLHPETLTTALAALKTADSEGRTVTLDEREHMVSTSQPKITTFIKNDDDGEVTAECGVCSTSSLEAHFTRECSLGWVHNTNLRTMCAQHRVYHAQQVQPL